MNFCMLEQDQKTFEYFHRYVDCFERNDTGLHLDNEIQAEELRRHLYLNRIDPSNREEKIRWIQDHGKPFRDYLNTIKLVYVVLKSMDVNPRTVSQEEFFRIEEKLNGMRNCLDSIF